LTIKTGTPRARPLTPVSSGLSIRSAALLRWGCWMPREGMIVISSDARNAKPPMMTISIRDVEAVIPGRRSLCCRAVDTRA
jgi:hypothetical protein